MEPTDFPESNKVWARDQEEYRPLPSWSNERETISRWSLTWRERFQVLMTGTMWLRQLNFGSPLQPQRPQTECPFIPGTQEPADAL